MSGDVGHTEPETLESSAGHRIDGAHCLSCLVDISEDLSASLDLDEILERVSQRLRQLFDYESFAVLLLDSLGKELRFRFAVGYPEDVIGQWRFGVGQGLVGTVARTRQAVWVGDVTRDSRFIHAGAEVASEMVLPLLVKNRLIGVLDLGSRQRDFFTEEHERILRPLAGNLANAIENARLYENVREQARSLSLLHQASRELASTLDRQELLAKLARMVRRLANYELFSVELWCEEENLLRTAFSIRSDGLPGPEHKTPLGQGICGTAAAVRRSSRVPNVHLDPHYVACNSGFQIRSELVVPLVHKEKLLGILNLESENYSAFTEQHEQMLSTLASTVAVALENATLYQRMKKDENQREQDLVTAREIQKGLLPDRAPRLPGLDIAFSYRPARHVGGDFYDFLSYGDGRLAIVAGDVAGKATAAALYGALAVGILRSRILEQGCCPAEMLKLLNDPLREPRIDNRFVALLFSLYDPRLRTLTIANAAFPHPWLIREGQVSQVHISGLPLGILPDVSYDETHLELKPGDTVVLASDGFNEAMNPQGEELGLARMHLLLERYGRETPEQLNRALLADVTNFIDGNAEDGDDQTLITLHVPFGE